MASPQCRNPEQELKPGRQAAFHQLKTRSRSRKLLLDGALIVLLLFGAKKIPELMKGLGKGIREFKEASKEVKENIEKGLDESR